MKNILIYFPYNLRTVEQQSVMEALHKRGYNIILYTSCKKGILHTIAENLGIIALASEKEYSKTFKNIWNNVFQLKQIIKKYNIDFIIVHQQEPALTVGILNTFKKIRFAYVRHNSDEDYQNFPVKAKLLNKITNGLTPIKIAPSLLVKEFWHKKEGVKENNITTINYGYNFNQYEQPDWENVTRIREKYTTSLLILSIARFVPQKQHLKMFAVIEQLMKKGIDCKLICLGSGYLEQELKQYVTKHNLQNNIFLVGRKDNIFDYIAAADIFLHLSNSEASNSAVKEVALYNKPVIVCKEVGDFEDYIIDRKNGFLVSLQNAVNESVAIIEDINNKIIDVNSLGKRFNSAVTTIFSIDNVIELYEAIINALPNKK
jgi:glycosyltransferase involved in cell wall biosynthesis